MVVSFSPLRQRRGGRGGACGGAYGAGGRGVGGGALARVRALRRVAAVRVEGVPPRPLAPPRPQPALAPPTLGADQRHGMVCRHGAAEIAEGWLKLRRVTHARILRWDNLLKHTVGPPSRSIGWCGAVSLTGSGQGQDWRRCCEIDRATRCCVRGATSFKGFHEE